MTFYVLLVSLGINIVAFRVYDGKDECLKATTDALAQYGLGDVDAVCVDMHDHQVVGWTGRGS